MCQICFVAERFYRQPLRRQPQLQPIKPQEAQGRNLCVMRSSQRTIKFRSQMS